MMVVTEPLTAENELNPFILPMQDLNQTAGVACCYLMLLLFAKQAVNNISFLTPAS